MKFYTGIGFISCNLLYHIKLSVVIKIKDGKLIKMTSHPRSLESLKTNLNKFVQHGIDISLIIWNHYTTTICHYQ